MIQIFGPVALLFFVGWLFMKRYKTKSLQNVWIEILLYGTLAYLVFTVSMTVNATYEQAVYDLESYADDYEKCRDPDYAIRKAKAGSPMCKIATKHHEMENWDLTSKRLHEMGLIKICSGYSLVEVFVNLSESSSWTFTIVVIMFVIISWERSSGGTSHLQWSRSTSHRLMFRTNLPQ